MVLSLALIGAFLGIWIKSSYDTEKKNLQKTLNVLYSELSQAQFSGYITQQVSQYVLQQQLAAGTLPIEQVVPGLQSVPGLLPYQNQLALKPRDQTSDHRVSDTASTDSSRQKLNTESLVEKVPTVQYYNSIDEVPDSLRDLVISQIKSISSDAHSISVVPVDDSLHAGPIESNTQLSRKLAGKAANLSASGSTGKQSTLADMLRQVISMVNGENMIKSLDTSKLYQDFSAQVDKEYKGLKVSNKRVYDHDLAIDNETTIASLLGMNVFVHDYQKYLWSGMYPQIIMSMVLLLICAFTFYFSYRTMVQQQQLTIQKNDFISNTAHELKTPITTSLLALEAFNHFEIKDNIEQTKEYIHIANSELKRLEFFVLNILNQLTLDQGAIQFHKTAVPFLNLLHNVVSKYKAAINLREKDLEIIQPVPPVMLFGDFLHLESAIGNVLDNAIKYGKEKIRIRAYKDDAMIVLHIEDDGDGIASGAHKKVFEKFYRIHSDKGHIVKGHGLGLAYTQYIIKAHEGSIAVSRSEMGGAAFIVKIPIKQS